MNYKEAKALADARDSTLTSDDPRFRHMVQLIHEDGTVLTYTYTFFVPIDRWYLVFTEHHGSHVYAKDDIHDISEWQRVC